jgi:hypothetical protein
MTDLKRLNVRVRPEMHEWLQAAGEARGLSMNAMVIIAIETYVQQQQMIPMLPQIMEQLERQKLQGDMSSESRA